MGTGDFDPVCFDFSGNDILEFNDTYGDLFALTPCEWNKLDAPCNVDDSSENEKGPFSAKKRIRRLTRAHIKIISHLIETRAIGGGNLVEIATEEFSRNNLLEINAKAISYFASKNRVKSGVSESYEAVAMKYRIMKDLLARPEYDINASHTEMHADFLNGMEEAGFQCEMTLPTFQTHLRKARGQLSQNSPKTGGVRRQLKIRNAARSSLVGLGKRDITSPGQRDRGRDESSGSGNLDDSSNACFEDKHFRSILDRALRRREFGEQSRYRIASLNQANQRDSTQHKALAHDVLKTLGDIPVKRKLEFLRKLETELNLDEMNEGTFKMHAVGVRIFKSSPCESKRREPKVGWDTESILRSILGRMQTFHSQIFCKELRIIIWMHTPPSEKELSSWFHYKRRHARFEQNVMEHTNEIFEYSRRIEASSSGNQQIGPTIPTSY